MTFRPEFEVPETVLVDPETGYAMNIPISLQGYPFWWEEEPAKLASLNMARERAGIVIDDFPNGPMAREEVRSIPMGTPQKRTK